MTTLTTFIRELDDLFKKNDPLVEKIKSPEKFLAALRELDDLVEMYDAKEAVVSQIKFLLVSIASGRPYSGHMLHGVIYGPPGVGKTKLGICRAKVWLAMGLLNPHPRSLPERKTKEERIKQLEELVNRKEETIRELRKYHRHYLDYVKVARHNTRQIEKAKNRADRYKYIDNVIHNLDKIIDDLEKEVENEKIVEARYEKGEEDIPFVVASRPDFVGKYVGHSAPKTRAFFEANRGKVIFIDEAYSLVLDDKDAFGFEALTELNKCMSEYPDTIVEMAGYKELMRKTIFDERIGQPGLERRCAWVFDIKGYSPKGLASIFRYQLSKDGWSVEGGVDLDKFFEKNKEHFKAYGGDTEKLCFYAKQIHSDFVFEEAKKNQATYTSCLTLPMIESALEMLKKNKALPLGPQIPPPPDGMYL